MVPFGMKRPTRPGEGADVCSDETKQRDAPATPRHYGNAAAWIVVLVAVASITAGIAVGEVLLLVGGLVLAASTGHLFQPPASPPRRRRPSQKR